MNVLVYFRSLVLFHRRESKDILALVLNAYLFSFMCLGASLFYLLVSRLILRALFKGQSDTSALIHLPRRFLCYKRKGFTILMNIEIKIEDILTTHKLHIWFNQ